MTAGRITARVPVRQISTILFPAIVAVGVGAATRANMLPLVLAASALAVLLLVGLRSPMLVLGLFAALVPLEEALALGGVGTATRFVGLVFMLAYVVNRRQLPRFSTMPPAGWALVLWAAASGLWTMDFAASADAIVTLLQMFALALLVGDLVSRDPTAARKVMLAYSASAVVTVFVLVAAPALSGGIAEAGRMAAFSGQDPAQFSAVLVPAILFLVYEGVRASTTRDAGAVAVMLYLAGAGLVAWGAFESGTRSAFIGLGAGMAAITATGTGHRWGRLAIAGVSVIAAGAALLVPGFADPLLNRFSDSLLTGGSGRLDIWAVGATIFAQHPLLGVGYAAFPAAFTVHVIRISAVPGLDLEALSVGRGPHSLLVGTAAELGIIGLALLGLFLWTVLSARSSLGFWHLVRAAIIAMLAQAMLLDVLGRKQLWLVLGIAVGLAAAARDQQARAEALCEPPAAQWATVGRPRRRS